jgi:hypothetical protein
LDLSKKFGKQQFLTYYMIAAHPGCTMNDMYQLKDFANRELKMNPEQVQVFTPTPSTYSTLMYYTGVDPFTGEEIFVEKDYAGVVRQKEIAVQKGQPQDDYARRGDSGRRQSSGRDSRGDQSRGRDSSRRERYQRDGSQGDQGRREGSQRSEGRRDSSYKGQGRKDSANREQKWRDSSQKGQKKNDSARRKQPPKDSENRKKDED